MPYTVFVGHDGEDFDIVEAIQDAARPTGVRVYAYEQDRQPGSRLDEKLQQRIREADALVVLLTEKGVKNATVHSEIGIAKEAGTTIVPVLDEEAISIERLPFLQGFEYLPFDRNDPALTIRELTTHLAHLAGKQEEEQLHQQRAFLLVGAALLLWASSS